MRTRNLVWVIGGILILGIISLWILTIQEGNRILNRNKSEPVPYYSKESGEDEDKNP
jgi:hypothetical protein